MPKTEEDKIKEEEERSREANSEHVTHISVKAPEFSETSVEGWFAILDAQFALKGVTTQVTKFYNAIAALPASVVDKLPSSVITGNSYDKVKSAIVAIYEQSKPELLDRLMETTTLSGRPSEKLHELTNLARKINVPDDIARLKFLQTLPPNISSVLAAQKTLDMDQLGALANELLPYFATQQSTSVMAIAPNNSYKPDRSYEPRAPWHNNNYNPRNFSPVSTIPLPIRPYKEGQRTKVCRSHLYYGGRAHTCKPWCTWPEKRGCKLLPNSRPSSRSSSPAGNSRQEN